jgi:hypothetical protein
MAAVANGKEDMSACDQRANCSCRKIGEERQTAHALESKSQRVTRIIYYLFHINKLYTTNIRDK